MMMIFTKQQHTRLDFPFHGPDLESHCPVFCVVGTCDGLLCLFDDLFTYTDIFYLWNPCVRKILRLPYPNVTFSTHGGFDASLGFGFDPKTNDNKVVRVVSLVDTLDLRKDQPKVEVYSLSTNKWKMVKASLVPRCVIDGRAPQAFVNGALHWHVFTRADDGSFHQFVLVFDLGDEVFRKMQLPQLPAYTRERMRLYSPISTHRNSIAFFHQDYNSHCRYMGDETVWCCFLVDQSFKFNNDLSRWLPFKRLYMEGSRFQKEWQDCVGNGWRAPRVIGS